MADAIPETLPAYLIWWLTQEEWEAASVRGMDGLPGYVREEFMKFRGFPSRARLWISDELEIALPDGSDRIESGGGEGEGLASGIVIRREDVGHLAGWPGRVTDTRMNEVREQAGAFA